MHCLVRIRREITIEDEEIRHFSDELPWTIANALTVLDRDRVGRESLQHNIKVHLEEANIGDLNTTSLEINIWVSGFSTDQRACKERRERIINGINGKAPSGIKMAVQVSFSN